MSEELTPSLAATVVVLRHSPSGAGAPEVLLLQRNHSLVFFGGYWVFPGGRVDAGDWRGAPNSRNAVEVALAAESAAIREAREEAGLELMPGQLHYIAHWVTPPGPPRRFDTWFFVATDAGAESITIDNSEIIDFQWQAAAAALKMQEAGDFPLPLPTLFTLESIKEFESVDEVLDWARQQKPEPVTG